MLNPLIKFLLPYWLKWSQRERLLVCGSAVLICFCLFYIGIERPLQEALRHTQTIVQDKQMTLATLERMGPMLKKSHIAEQISLTKLLGLIHHQLDRHATLHNYPYHLTQHATHQLELKFEKVPFNHFLHWFLELNMRYHVNITHLQAQRSDEPGIAAVSCEIAVI